MLLAAGVFLLLVALVNPPLPVVAHAAGNEDFAGLVDIGGGRKIYMECRGSGSPTVVLISGKGNRADIWTTPNPEKPGPIVFPEVARFTRVCAYDRPGTTGALASEPSRSNPVPEPVTIADGVADLRALLTASREAGPFVLAGHSIGGLISRLYASTYPTDVSGLVLIDALSEDLYNGLTLEQKAVFEKLNDVPEKYDNVRSFKQVRAAPSVRAMPVIVLTADQPPITANDVAAGRFPPEVTANFADALWAAQMRAQDSLARLFPNAKRITNTKSHHYIQNEQPQLVIDSIREVVDAVRDPNSWRRSETITARSKKNPPAQAGASGSAVSKNAAGLVDIGGGRKVYLECHGSGSPTVVLISGTRGAHDDWTDLIDPKNPTGAPKPGESAVLPQVSKFTRVCAYDRPGTTLNNNTVTDSTPVRQPTTAQEAAADLHALLTAAGEPGPFVLVGHSWGGLIARLFANIYPDDVSGLVLVDPASEFLKSSLTPAQWATYIEATKKLIEPNGLEAPDHSRTLELLHGTPQVPPLPVIVLTSDKRFDFGAGGSETWPAWRTAQDRLAEVLDAKHVSSTNSGHAIQMEQPQLVVTAIRQVVEAVRNGSHQVAPAAKNTGLPPIAESSRIALEKGLDEGFAKSGLPGVITGLWIPGTGEWIASRGVSNLKTKAPMTADLQAPIGSITKSFAVTIALQLVGEHKLRLEDTIERWYPQIPEASAITIKMLLNHSSGFPDISMLQLDLHCTDPTRFVTPDELIAMGIKLPRAQFRPGKGFLYSSLNTIVLGRILEKITGESFDALLNKRLLKPLELRRTKLDTDGKLDPPFCHGYTDFCRNLPKHTDTSGWPQFSFAAGALASTLSDLHQWGIALGEGFGLTPALRKARIEEELGIAIQRERPGGRVISLGHAGSEAGYSANVQYYPCTGAVWTLMANGDGGTGEAFIAVLKALQPIVEPLAVPSEKCATAR